MKSKYWKSLPYAVVIAALCACITWPVALVFFVAFICGCISDEMKISRESEKTPVEIEEDRAFRIKLLSQLTKEQRVLGIDNYLFKECKRPNEEIWWLYDAYPEEMQEVLAKYLITYDPEEKKVKKLKRK